MCQNFPARDPNLKCDGGDVINYTKTLVGEEEKIYLVSENYTLLLNDLNSVESSFYLLEAEINILEETKKLRKLFRVKPVIRKSWIM